jgi:hypothetical protein
MAKLLTNQLAQPLRCLLVAINILFFIGLAKPLHIIIYRPLSPAIHNVFLLGQAVNVLTMVSSMYSPEIWKLWMLQVES